MVAVLGAAILPGTALADDGTPPTLDALTFTPASIVNGASPVTITVTATITDPAGVADRAVDPATGEVLIEGPTITFSPPGGSATVSGFFERDLSTADPDDFTVDVTFPRYAAVGEWTAFFSAPDVDYNWLYLDASALALIGPGFAGAVTVSGTSDVTPPTLVSISPTSQSVDVGDCNYLNRRVQFDTVITDDLSGFDPGSLITFTSPSGTPWQTGFDRQGADHYLVELGLDMDTEVGTWTAYDAVLTDVVGNTSYLSAADLPVSFDVTRTFQGGPPGTPTNVTVTIAADGEATVTWVAPTENGGSAITGYGISVGFGEQGTTGGVDANTTSFSIGVLTPGVTYTVAVSADNACGSTQSGPVTVAAIPTDGGTVSTQPGAGPVTTEVIVPAGAGGGSVTITETALGTAPAGYEFVGQQLEIDSTAATTVDNPLTLAFHIDDPSLVPVTIFRNGVPITSSCSPTSTATPSPCIASGAGTADITILTASASTWNVGQRLGYDFSGFLGGVSNPPAINEVKAGATVKLQFSLGGDQGLGVIASGYPASAAHACASPGPDNATEPTLAGPKGLTFDAKKGVYTYWWRTSADWKKTCRTFVLKLTDGTFHSAEFHFK